MAWDESKHPRKKENGRFDKKDGSSSSAYTDGVNARIAEAKRLGIPVPLNADGSVDDLRLQEDIDKEKQFRARKVIQKCHEIEKLSRHLDYEVGTIISPDGLVIASNDGGSNVVYMDKSLLKGNIVTHNHPKGSMFSTDDIKGFIEGELLQLRASTPSGKVYVITRVKDWVKPNLLSDYKKAGTRGTEGAREVQRKFEEYSEFLSEYDAFCKAVNEYKENWLYENAHKYNIKFEVEWND